jgi:hypothetical protein
MIDFLWFVTPLPKRLKNDIEIDLLRNQLLQMWTEFTQKSPALSDVLPEVNGEFEGTSLFHLQYRGMSET